MPNISLTLVESLPAGSWDDPVLQNMRRQVEAAEAPSLRAIAIDSLSMGSPNKYRVVISDLDQGRPVWVGDAGRREADLDLFFASLSDDQRASISLVVMDMWAPFIKSVSKNVAHAGIVHDRYFVLGHLSKCLEEVWQQEHKALKSEDRGYVKGRRYTLLSKRENTALDGSQALKKKLRANRRLHTARVLEDTFRQFWELRKEADAVAFFTHWKEGLRRQGLDPFQKFVELLESNWEGLLAWCKPEYNIDPDTVERIHKQLEQLLPGNGIDTGDALFKLQIIASYLPPLTLEPPSVVPESTELQRQSTEIDAVPVQEATVEAAAAQTAAPPEPKMEPDQEDSGRILQAWLTVLCTMLPDVVMGAVSEHSKEAVKEIAVSWPPGSSPGDQFEQAIALARSKRATTLHGNVFAHPLGQSTLPGTVVAIQLDVAKEQQAIVLQVLRWGEQWLQLLLHVPAGEKVGARESAQAALQTALEPVLRAKPLQAAVLAISNQLASRYHCERVVVGLVAAGKTRVSAISHGAVFDSRTDLVRDLETAMEEIRVADSLALWPPNPGQKSPALQRLVANESGRALCALPLPGDEHPIGVLLCERKATRVFSQSEQEELQTLARLYGPVIQLKQASFGTNFRRALTRLLDKIIKPGNSALKLGFAAAALCACVLLFGQGIYHVSADASIEGLVQRAVVAPFDGYVAEATVRAGDRVTEGQTIARLEDRELRLELRQSTSEEAKLENEYRKALAGLDRSEAAIMQARLAQAQARSRLLKHRLDQVQLNAPLDGIVIAGDLSRSLGAPVERGDILFEVAPVDAYRLVLEVDERDISRVALGQTGFLKLAALPGERLEFVVVQVSPVFEETDGVISYRTEARIEGEMSALRPGMEGVGKIEIGQRSYGWLLLHRMLDWIRLQWWIWLP